jgi:S-phase kinase-associated protein 1
MATQRQILKFQNKIEPNRQVFTVDGVAAKHSILVRHLLEDFGTAHFADNIIPVYIDVSEAGLASVFGWMHHNRDLPHEDEADKAKAVVAAPLDLTPWDKRYFGALDSQLLYEVLVIANYLDLQPLYQRACAFVADMIRGKSTEEIRNILNIQSDFTEEQAEFVSN